MSLIRPSGGLYWHWRALRHQTQWLPFSREIAAWLEQWQPDNSGLILVGPSGGWSMSGIWLQRFQHVVMVDPDPAAKWIFTLRHRKSLHNITYDWINARFEDCLERKLVEYPAHCVLFCNVLGQIRYERADYERVLARVPKLLAGRSWASYHDCLSSDPQPYREDLKPFNSQSRMDEKVLSHYKLGGVWMDHGTQGLFSPTQDLRYIPWWFSRHRLHWVQAGWINPHR
jgi:hypothetical protein